jgi:predicted DsbA family dithiol-disulfide isomerase
MTETVTIWSDVHCPWAVVAVHRLRAARAADDLDVVFDPSPWPLELVNGSGAPYDIVTQEVAALASHEPELFSAFSGRSRPSTFLPAFELIAVARRLSGLRAAEDLDYQLRVAFFRDSVDLSVRAGLGEAVRAAADSNRALDPEAVLAQWDTGSGRAEVLADYERSRRLPIEGSPQVFWPDGTTSHNPGMTNHYWLRGIPRITSTDPAAPARLLQAALEKTGVDRPR